MRNNKRITKNGAFEFQQEIYKYLLKRKSKGNIQVSVQDVDETNAILERSDIKNLTTKEMCDLLGVDAIMTSNFGLEKPMSTGGAIALAVLTGFGASTNKVTVTLGIKNCDDNLHYGSMIINILVVLDHLLERWLMG